MNARTATWLGGSGSTLSHVDQDLRLRRKHKPFGCTSSSSSFLAQHEEASRFVGTGFIGGMPSPQQRGHASPGRRHPQPVTELLRPGIVGEATAFFPAASSQVMRHSRRISHLQGQIEAERLEFRRLDAALRERLAVAEEGATRGLGRSSSLGSLPLPPSPTRARLRAINESGLSPSLSRTQRLGSMAIRGASFGLPHTHRPGLTLQERRMADAASLTLCSPRSATPEAGYEAAARKVDDRGIGIQYPPSLAPRWDMRPRDKTVRGFAGILGV